MNVTLIKGSPYRTAGDPPDDRYEVLAPDETGYGPVAYVCGVHINGPRIVAEAAIEQLADRLEGVDEFLIRWNPGGGCSKWLIMREATVVPA